MKKALDPPPPPKEPRSPEYGSAGIRPPSPPAPISTGRLRAAPQRLDASVLVEPLYGKGGPVREASAREESKAAPEAAAKAPAASAPARGIGVGSRVQDSEGTCGEIVEANNAWLTMRTDAGEERKVRKFTLKLIASGTGAAPEAAAAAQRPPRATEAACLACAGKHRPHTCGKKHAVRVKLEDAAEPPDIGVGSRVQDSEGTCGEIVEANKAWLTMRTDAGEERKVRKFTLKLIASETGAAPALKAAAKAAPVTSAASQPAGGDVRITRTRTRDERDAELRRNTIDVEAIDVEAIGVEQPTVTNVPQGERFTFCPPCADAEEGGAAAAVDDDDANSDADADAADDDEDDHDDEDEDKEEECAACGGTDTHPGNEIMLCDGDGCDGAWHQLCLRPAVVDVPEEDEASPPPTQSLPLP